MNAKNRYHDELDRLKKSVEELRTRTGRRKILLCRVQPRQSAECNLVKAEWGTWDTLAWAKDLQILSMEILSEREVKAHPLFGASGFPAVVIDERLPESLKEFCDALAVHYDFALPEISNILREIELDHF